MSSLLELAVEILQLLGISLDSKKYEFKLQTQNALIFLLKKIGETRTKESEIEEVRFLSQKKGQNEDGKDTTSVEFKFDERCYVLSISGERFERDRDGDTIRYADLSLQRYDGVQYKTVFSAKGAQNTDNEFCRWRFLQIKRLEEGDWTEEIVTLHKLFLIHQEQQKYNLEEKYLGQQSDTTIQEHL